MSKRMFLHDDPLRDEELGRLLRESAAKPMTPEERFEQKVSWVYGMLPHDTPLTKEDVRRHLLENP